MFIHLIIVNLSMEADPEIFDLLDTELINLLTHVNNSMLILESFDESKRRSLYDKLQDLIASFRTLQQLKPKVKGAVPLRVLSLSDEGRNPDELARALVQASHESARRVQLKHKWMQCLKDSLDSHIDLNFPDAPLRSETLP
jgi:hypothetical protein